MTDDPKREEGFARGARRRLSDLAEALLDNPLFSQAVSTALGAGERAAQAQRSAMGALNIPARRPTSSALEQRLRSLSTGSRRLRTNSTTRSTSSPRFAGGPR